MSKKLILLFAIVMFATFSFADVNVTFRANSSQVQGICDTLGGVDLRGTVTQWGPGTNLTNVGGDYWEITLQLAPGNYEYKYGGQVIDPITGSSTDYWENDLPGAVAVSNRTLTVGTTDMMLDLDFVGRPQEFALFTDAAKNEVLFRVNMGALNGFNADEDKVYIVGAFPNPDGSSNMWVPDKYELTREGTSNYFYYMLPLDATYEKTMYRYTLGSWDQSENLSGAYFDGNENRGTVVNSDTTIAWKWWNDAAPVAVSGDTIAVTFKVDLSKAINTNGFSIGDGDSLCVRVGYFNTAQYVEAGMQKVGLGGFNYQATFDELIIAGLGEGVFYQYYKIPGAATGEVRETYFNFDYTGGNASEAERRWVALNMDGQIIEDNVDSKTDSRRMPEFRNTNSVSQNVDVTFTLDLRPAYHHVANGIVLNDIQGSLTINNVQQITDGGVFLNGPASGGWTGWGTELSNAAEKKMWDDGSHGDAVAGDTIYTIQFSYAPDSSNNTIGQEFKFGIGGGDNESGYGLNHIQNIDDSQPTAVIHSQWGSINPVFYYLWDYNTEKPIKPVAEDDLFISEYIEGGSNNKALEIYNGTGETVDLANYIMLGNYNGNAWSEVFTFEAGATIADGDVYVIAHNQADAAILNVADAAYAYGSPWYIASFNGDDVRALCKVNGSDTTIIDLFGAYDMVDPGDGWAVAGVDNATKDHTLVRKLSVTKGNTNWAASAGTTADNSEWIVYDNNDFSHIGWHGENPTPTEVKVTIRANTSMIQGLTDTLGYVDVRGNLNVGDPTSYQDGDWSGERDFLTNVGGDYWERTYTIPGEFIGGTVEFKFGVGLVDFITGDTTSYWENDAPGATTVDNRSFVIPSEDTVLDLAFVGRQQGATPFTDAVKNEVLFRVNMGAVNGFDAATDKVFIVGAFPGPDGSENMWVPDKYELTREGESDYFQFLLPLDTTYGATMYRYTQGSWDLSENVRGHGLFPDNENRGTVVNGDTTIAWKWWNDAPPAAVTGDTIGVTFKVDLTKAINTNGFSIGDGDSLCVRVGYFNTAQYVEAGMQKVGLGGFIYQASFDSLIIAGLGEGVFYQYYKIPGVASGEVRETYFNFDYTGGNASEAERRWILLESNGQIIEDNVDSKTDSRRMPEFRNTNSVSQNVDVTFTLDLRPAYHHVASGIQLNDIQGSLTITSVDQIDNLGVFINGPASGGWTGWGTELSNAAEKKMWDDGSHGDAVAGDTIYTVQFSYAPDSSNNTIGQEFKFGIGGGDNESGYGLNHIENIDDSQPTAVIHSQWGSINPVFYRLWNYDTETPIPSSIENEIQFADKYELEQNYPNPFNPSTNIRFSVKDANQVTLTIYNMMGQKVQETVYNNVNAGVYNYSWDARDLNGQRVSTGIYFYKLQADNKFSSVKKMVFMK